jgi:hypothetical protein
MPISLIDHAEVSKVFPQLASSELKLRAKFDDLVSGKAGEMKNFRT